MIGAAKIRRETAERMGETAPADPGEAMQPCRYCGSATKRSTLTTLGARCHSCYEQWLRCGYSGPDPAPQSPKAAWVKKAAERAASVGTARQVAGHVGDAIQQRAESVCAGRSIPRGLSDEQVNDMLEDMRT